MHELTCRGYKRKRCSSPTVDTGTRGISIPPWHRCQPCQSYVGQSISAYRAVGMRRPCLVYHTHTKIANIVRLLRWGICVSIGKPVETFDEYIPSDTQDVYEQGFKAATQNRTSRKEDSGVGIELWSLTRARRAFGWLCGCADLALSSSSTAVKQFRGLTSA